MLPAMHIQLCKVLTQSSTVAARRQALVRIQICNLHNQLPLTRRPVQCLQTSLPWTYTRPAIVNVSRRWLASTSEDDDSNTSGKTTKIKANSATAAIKQKAESAKNVINKLKEKTIPTHENIYTIPNFLTFARLLSAPFIGYLIVEHDYQLALGVFALAGFTDLLDGYIARKYNLKTVVGSIIDPAADKALMTVMTVTLAAENVLPIPLAALILGRDAGLVLAAFYYRYISLPEPKTLFRYFDFSIPSAEVRPTMISKVNTALQLVLMAASLTSTALGVPSQEIMTALQWTVGGTTVWSGASYIYSKDAVRILTNNRQK